jgi:hypothetical protein
MKNLKSFRFVLVWLLIFLLALSPAALAQDSKGAAGKKFSKEELDQMLAPIALYPDALLAQVLMASTYPLEVVMADRWVKQNKTLTGDKLKEAADKQPWDPSVKALVIFPDLLSTMTEKLDWTEKLGAAFLAQQTDVMDTVQGLRKKAYEAGNLMSTNEQHVIAEKEVIRIEPADPRVVYVPVYDPWWVYGPWWWPYYPPYAFYPYPYSAGVAIAPGFIGFSFGFFIGSYWGHWGYCDWHHHDVYVNSHYYGYPHHGHSNANNTIGSFGGATQNGRPSGPPPANNTVGSFGGTRQNLRTTGSPSVNNTIGSSGSATQRWTHDPSHRRGVAYRNSSVSDRFGQMSRTTADNRQVSRTFQDNMARRTTVTRANAAGGTGRTDVAGRTGGAYGSVDRRGRPDASVSRTTSDRRVSDRQFEDIRSGRSYSTVERNGRIDTSSTPRKALERNRVDRPATERAYRPSPERARTFSAPERVSRGPMVQQPGSSGRGVSAPTPKSQNWTGVFGGQGGGDVISPNRGSGWSGGGLGAPRGGSAGSGGHVGGWGGGGFRGGR